MSRTQSIEDRAFRTYDTRRDEALDADGQPHPWLEPAYRALQELPRAELQTRQARIQRACAEVGEHFYVHENDEPIARDWKLDLVPRVLNPDDWAQVECGLIQRARAFNAYVHDLHNEQRILREKIIPAQIALSDPAFKRELSDIPAPRGQYITVAAVDLLRDENGEWLVTDNNMATPFGASFLIQNRRILAQYLPELFAALPVAPVAPFTTHIEEALRALSPRRNAHVVLLTRGEDNHTYFEESFLARHMGVAMVKPGDLLVRESKLFLKTVQGLERVDVIYRRIDGASMDPIAFAQCHQQGIPGIVNCVRKGNVVVANALGCGVADNRAILRYSDRIIGFYLNERPLLRTLTTYNLGDRDQADFVLHHRDDMMLKPIHEPSMLRQHVQKVFDTPDIDYDRLAQTHRHLLVAQPRVRPTRVPRFTGEEFAPRPVYLRAFLVLGDDPVVLPGGLTRQLVDEAERPGTAPAQVGEGMKDTWVIGRELPHGRDPRLSREELDPGDFSIGSRVAESLYWLGRYLERAENTSRQLNTLESLRWEQLGKAMQRAYWPLWKAIAAATGQKGFSRRKQPPEDTLQLSSALVFDKSESASVRNCIHNSLLNARFIREFISPEAWQLLQAIDVYLREKDGARSYSRPVLREVCQEIVYRTAAFNGTAERTMLHEDSLQFYRIGAQMERAIATVKILQGVLVGRENNEPILLETDLTAVLRIFGALDAYRREYRSRAYLDRVVHLILKSPNCPSAVGFSLRMLRYSLGTLTRTGDQPPPAIDKLGALIHYADSIPIHGIFPPATESLDRGEAPLLRDPSGSARMLWEYSQALLKGLEDFHQLVEDTYFSHLAYVPLEEQTRLEL